MGALVGDLVRAVTGLSPNGPHQRPHANLSARGREGLGIAGGQIARGRALYASRRAACVCWATRYLSRFLSRATILPSLAPLGHRTAMSGDARSSAISVAIALAAAYVGSSRYIMYHEMTPSRSSDT
jgi:hypothetical protein